VDRSLKFWHKFLKWYIEYDGGRTPPKGGRCPLDVVGGLIVRRESSDTKGSARFARSLTARDKDFARDTHDLRRVALPDLVG
jgi:hypothetical protein